MGFQPSWLLLYCYNSRVRKWDRECMAHKVESIYCLALYRQGFSSLLYRIQRTQNKCVCSQQDVCSSKCGCLFIRGEEGTRYFSEISLIAVFVICSFLFQTRSHFEALKPRLALKSRQSWPCFTCSDCTHEAPHLTYVIVLYYDCHLCVCWCMVRGMNTHHARCRSVANFTD